jgi:ABC-type transport system substrate-binding protein
VLEPAKTRGGTLRWFGLDPLTLDTMDPHQTQFASVYNLQGCVFSKVLRYDDEYEGVIGPDVAEAVPEVVDKTTYVIKIRPNVFFHDTERIRGQFPEVAGRQLTAEDVRYSIERQKNKQSPKSALFYRGYQWEAVDKIEVGPDPLQLTITTKGPVAPFMHYLADTYAAIVPKELVDPESDDMNSFDKMIGTGPFMLEKFVTLQVVKCLRNPNWFAKDDLADQGLPITPRGGALPLDELTQRPGYRFRREEREQDLADAKAMWEAAGGASIGSVECLYAGIPDFLKNLFPAFQKMLVDTLGLDVKGRLDATGYTELAQAALQKRAIFSLGYDNGFNDLDDFVYPYFHSTGVKNSFMLADATLDQMLDAQRAEFDQSRRQQLGYEIQRYLLDNVQAKLDWVGDIAMWAQWPYRRNRRIQPWFGETFLLADEWIYSAHPTYQGRPA